MSFFPDLSGIPFPQDDGTGQPSQLGDTLALRRYLGMLGYPTGENAMDPIQPNLIPSPGLRIGPVRLSGQGLDSAALSVLGALQGMPRPQGFGANFGTGLAMGLAGGRARMAENRAAANQAAVQSAAKANEDRQSAARAFAQGLANHRYAMEREAATQAAIAARQRAPQQNEAYIYLDTPEKEAAFKKQFPNIPVPFDKIIPRSQLFPTAGERTPKQTLAEKFPPETFSQDVVTSLNGKKYLNTGAYVGEQRLAASAAAKALGAVPLTADQSAAMDDTDTAKIGVQALRTAINGMLPTDAAGRVIAAPSNKLSAYFQTKDDLAAWGAMRQRAIRFLRATAGSKNFRMTQAEIWTSMQNDIPNITDTVGAAMQKLQNIEDQLSEIQDVTVSRNRPDVLDATMAKYSLRKRARSVAKPSGAKGMAGTFDSAVSDTTGGPR